MTAPSRTEEVGIGRQEGAGEVANLWVNLVVTISPWGDSAAVFDHGAVERQVRWRSPLTAAACSGNSVENWTLWGSGNAGHYSHPHGVATPNSWCPLGMHGFAIDPVRL